MSLPVEQSAGITVTYTCHFQMKQGRKKLYKGAHKTLSSKPKSTTKKPSQIPPVTKLLALAHYYQELLATGKVKDYAEIAKLTGVTRARLTQTMNLSFLAPDIQKALLCSPFADYKKTERSIREIAGCLSWQEQLDRWNYIM